MSNQAPMADDPRSRLAAELFPREWARVATKPGASKARQQLRQRAEMLAKFRALKAGGASCATCRSFEKRRHGDEMMCAFSSDFYGDVIAKPDGLCTDYSRATNA